MYANPFIHKISPCVIELKKSPRIVNNLCNVAGYVTIKMRTQNLPHSTWQGCLPGQVIVKSVILKKP
jgi:hypothetical protein